MGNHKAALRVLALVLGDLQAAEDYCKQHAGQPGYLALLSMLLAPDDGRSPLYAEACRLLAAQGVSLLQDNVINAPCCSLPTHALKTDLMRPFKHICRSSSGAMLPTEHNAGPARLAEVPPPDLLLSAL